MHINKLDITYHIIHTYYTINKFTYTYMHYIDILHVQIHIPHITIYYIDYTEPYKLQYLHIYTHIRYMYTSTYIGYMHAYYIHITNINPYTRHTHTKHKNIPKIYIHKYITYIHIHTFIHVHTYHHIHTYIHIHTLNICIHITNTHPCTLPHVH